MTLWLQPDGDGPGTASASIGRPTHGGIAVEAAEVSERTDGQPGCVVRTVGGEWTVRGLPVSIARKHLDAGKRQEG